MTALGELLAYKPTKGDVLFFETANDVTPETLVTLKAAIQERLPEGVEVLVLSGIRVSVVHKRKRRWWLAAAEREINSR